jgi:uncharacterized protein involved in outer membrane biogenesis
MKKILLAVLALLFVLVISAVGYLYFSLNTLVKKAVETVGPRITKTDVRLSSANISPFSGSGSLNGFVIGNPEGFGKEPALRFGSIQVKVEKTTLLKEVIDVESVIIRNPDILLEGTLRGNNLGKLLQNIKSSSSSKSSEEKTSAKDSKKFVVKEVAISGIKLRLAASALDQKVEQSLPLPEIRLQNIGSDGSGVSASELATQILTPLLQSAVTEGVNALAKQGLRELQKNGGAQIENAIKGLFK